MWSVNRCARSLNRRRARVRRPFGAPANKADRVCMYRKQQPTPMMRSCVAGGQTAHRTIKLKCKMSSTLGNRPEIASVPVQSPQTSHAPRKKRSKFHCSPRAVTKQTCSLLLHVTGQPLSAWKFNTGISINASFPSLENLKLGSKLPRFRTTQL